MDCLHLNYDRNIMSCGSYHVNCLDCGAVLGVVRDSCEVEGNTHV